MARPMRGSGQRPQRDKLRSTLYAQQKGLCHLCGKLMVIARRDGVKNVPPSFATFDHKKPTSEGGTAYYMNLALAHRHCNNARGSKPIAQPLTKSEP